MTEQLGDHGNMAAALADPRVHGDGRLAEAVRVMRVTDALLRAQVDGLEKLRDRLTADIDGERRPRVHGGELAAERDAALALVRELADCLDMFNRVDPSTDANSLIVRARALLAKAGIGDGAK